MRNCKRLWVSQSGKYYFAIYDEQSEYYHYGSGNIDLHISESEVLKLLSSGNGKNIYSREGYGLKNNQGLINFIKARVNDKELL